jgi:hypothetical protein
MQHDGQSIADDIVSKSQPRSLEVPHAAMIAPTTGARRLLLWAYAAVGKSPHHAVFGAFLVRGAAAG